MTEFFERFTYYGMRAMLVLFLAASATGANPGFGIDDETGRRGVCVCSPARPISCCVPGGWIADRLIGQRKRGVLRRRLHRDRQLHPGDSGARRAVFYLRPRGHRARHRPAEAERLERRRRAVRRPGRRAARRRLLDLLHGHQSRRGARPVHRGPALGEELELAPRVSAPAAVAMLIGLAAVQADARSISARAGMRRRTCRPSSASARGCWWPSSASRVLIGASVAVPAARTCRRETALAQGLFIAQVALAVGFFGYVLFFGGLTAVEKKRVGVIVMFFLCAALFWGGFEQQATTFNTFAVDYTDRSLARQHVPGGRAPGGVVPVDQPDLHHPLRAVLRVDLGGARRAQSRSVRAGQDGHRPHAAGRRLPRHDVGGASSWCRAAARSARPGCCWPT